VSLNEIWLKKRAKTRVGTDEAKDAPTPAAQGFNDIVRRKLGDIASALRLTMPGSTFKETRAANNTFLLAPGGYGGATLSKTLSEMHAVSPGARMDRGLNLVGSAVIDGVLLAGSGPEGCAVVRSTATVIFRGCTFERPTDSVQSMVTVETSGRAIFLGCVFRGSGTTVLPMISHGGPAANVQVAFCYNATGNPTLFTPGTATGTGNI
jgi:hypothetical protein